MVTEKLSWLHMRDTFCPKSAKHLTEEKNWDALEYLMFLKVKWDVKVKGQICADGQKQRKKVVPLHQEVNSIFVWLVLFPLLYSFIGDKMDRHIY